MSPIGEPSENLCSLNQGDFASHLILWFFAQVKLGAFFIQVLKKLAR